MSWPTPCAPTGTDGSPCGRTTTTPGRLRALCRSRKDLVETRVQIVNQLRANLELAFPGAIGLFSKPDSPITLTFLRRFPNGGEGAMAVAQAPAKVGCARSATPAVSPRRVLYGRLDNAAPGLLGAEGMPGDG